MQTADKGWQGFKKQASRQLEFNVKSYGHPISQNLLYHIISNLHTGYFLPFSPLSRRIPLHSVLLRSGNPF